MKKKILLVGAYHEMIEVCEDAGYEIVGIIDNKAGDIRWRVPVTRLMLSAEILMDAAVLTGCYLTVVSRGA